MNILVPDRWLREFLETKATPKQLKEYLSLSGESVERVNTVGKDIVYDIEVTGNRPDVMSVAGIAREASVILPKFGIPATFIGDPYTHAPKTLKTTKTYTLNIETNSTINPRFTAIVVGNINNRPSPDWMQRYLELAGMRPINAIVDITNYLMKTYGQPVHAFDFDQILPNTMGVPTMILRESKKGESIVTLDGKKHTLPGGDIVIEDGSGRLIDLCGIMGGGVSHITDSTKNVLLFVQTYDPSHIRKTSMALGHRTEASALFEKGLDTELVMPTIQKGIALIEEFAQGTPQSILYDVYPNPYKKLSVSVSRAKIDIYIGKHLSSDDIVHILEALGFETTITKSSVSTLVPSYRRDVTLDVDIIEEIARIYGYHNIETKLPDTEPPMTFEDPILGTIQKLKNKIADWGFTEIYAYSMISEADMDIFGLNKHEAYTITNPLTDEWVYMRPSLLPSMLSVIKNNMTIDPDLKLFELSHIYEYQKNTVPNEIPMLLITVVGNQFKKMKGIAETIFSYFGIPFVSKPGTENPYFTSDVSLTLGGYGIVGELETTLLEDVGITKPVTTLELNIQKLFQSMSTKKTYIPVPKYPSSFEDIALIVPDAFQIGPLIDAIRSLDPLISNVSLLDEYKNVRTLHITYQSAEKNLTNEDTLPIREKILHLAESKYHATLKSL